MLRLDINLVFTIINVLILYFLLRKLLFKPVRNILAKRDAEIQKSYDDAAKVTADANQLKAQYEATLASADADKAAALNDARTRANAEYDRIIAEANDKSTAIVAEAKKKAEAAAAQEKIKADDEIARMTRDAVSRLADVQSDEKLYDAFLNQAGEDK